MKKAFLDVLILHSTNELNFTTYRKPTQNDRYLHFKSNHHPPPEVKRAVLICPVDRALNNCSDFYITAELNFIREILFGNGYPLLFINITINRTLKRQSLKINNNLLCENPDKPQNIIYLARLFLKSL